MIKATAEKGGAVFVNFYPAFIHQGFSDESEKLRRRYQRRIQAACESWPSKPEMCTYEEEKILRHFGRSLPSVGIKDVLKHVEYIAKIAGVESVGFGSDFDGIPFTPEGLEDCTGFPQLCDSLRKRGFKPSEIDKIAGGNFLRVFNDVVG
jgi:membrane dipeptidase